MPNPAFHTNKGLVRFALLGAILLLGSPVRTNGEVAVLITPAGGTIRVKIAARANEGYFFKVTDTGIGIAAENVALVLEPFGQVENEINRIERGSGLGLPLAKSMVELHGGSFELRSTSGVGTTITVCFPAKRILPPELARTESMNSQTQAEEALVGTDKTTASSDQSAHKIASK